jgi:hypothetical protein
MRFSELPSADLRPSSILIFNQPTVGAVLLGRMLVSPLKALVTNKHGFPVKDLTLTAAVESLTPDDRFVWCLARQQNGTLEAEALKDVCEVQLGGVTAKTNPDGVATFSDLHLKRGYPGTVRLRISLDWCEDTGCGEREFELEQKGLQDEKRVQIESFTDLTVLPTPLNVRAVSTAPKVVQIGVPMSESGAAAAREPAARVLDSDGAPVANATVVAFATANLSAIFAPRDGEAARPRLVPVGMDRALSGQDAPKLTILKQAVAVTGADGIARFGRLMVWATTTRSAVIAFYYGGKFDLWNAITPARGDGGHAILLVEEMALVDAEDTTQGTGGDSLHALRAVPRDTVKEKPWETRGKSVEGEVMTNVNVRVGFPVQQVASLRVWPVKGKRVVAVAAPYCSAEEEEEIAGSVGNEAARRAMLSSRLWRPFKVLQNAVSAASDDKGVAIFTDMSFSTSGVAGVYRIRFFVSGIEDPSLFLWQVYTSVRRIELNASVRSLPLASSPSFALSYLLAINASDLLPY